MPMAGEAPRQYSRRLRSTRAPLLGVRGMSTRGAAAAAALLLGG